MRRDEALALLAAHRPEISAFGVRSLALFGSVARDTAGPESDVDLLVDFDIPVGLFQMVRLKNYLETVLGRSGDLVTKDALRDHVRDRVLSEAVGAS